MRLICFYLNKIVVADKIFSTTEDVHRGFSQLFDKIAHEPDVAELTPIGYSAVPDQVLPGRYDKTR